MQQANSAKEYVHSVSAGNIEICREFASMAKQKLSESYAKKEIEGWETIIIHQKEDLDTHFILTDPCKVAGDKFPFLFLAIQHYQTENVGITKWVKNDGFIEVID